MPSDPPEQTSYSLDEMMDRLREGDREKRGGGQAELVTRPDGSQVMRKRKRKRRSEQPVRKSARGKTTSSRRFKILVLGVVSVLIVALLLAVLLLLAKYNSESYRTGLEEKLTEAVGGTVVLERMAVTPVKARAERVRMRWPEDALLKTAVFEEVEAELGLSGFLGAAWSGEEILARRGLVRLSSAPGAMVSYGDSPFGHQSFRCEKLTVAIGAGENPPVLLQGVELSLREGTGGARQLLLHGGLAAISGLQDMKIGNGTVRLQEDGLHLTSIWMKPVDGVGEVKVQGRSPIQADRPIDLGMELTNVRLGPLLGPGMESLLDGIVTSSEGTVQVSPEGFDKTTFRLSLTGTNAELGRLPFLISLRTMFSDTDYARPSFREISADLRRVGEELHIDNLVLRKKAFMEVRGHLIVTDEKALSGQLRVGIPENKIITVTGRKRYSAFSDPVDGYSWIDIELTGTVELPDDDLKHTLRRAALEASESRKTHGR